MSERTTSGGPPVVSTTDMPGGVAGRRSLSGARLFLLLLRERLWLVAAGAGVGLLLATVLNFATRPLYQATAQILIDRGAPRVLATQGPADDLAEVRDDATQLQLLRSRSLAERVVERLGLRGRLDLGSRLSIFGLPWPGGLSRDAIPIGGPAESDDLSPAGSAFLSRLTVEPVASSRLVNVRFAAHDPALAALAANTLVELYVVQSLEFRFKASSEAAAWLETRLAEERGKVGQAQRSSQEYGERQDILRTAEGDTFADQKLRALAAALLRAHEARLSKETLYNQMRSLPPSQLLALPNVKDVWAVQEAQARLAELRMEEERLSEVSGDRHPEVIRIRAEIRAAGRSLDTESRSVVRALEGDYSTARREEERLQNELEAAKQEVLETNRRSIEMGFLDRDAESHERLFRSVLDRATEASLATAAPLTNVRIVYKAATPTAPVRPRKAWNYAVGLLLGLGAAIGLALLLDRLDGTLKTVDDVKAALGRPVLAAIPRFSPGADPRSWQDAFHRLRTNVVHSTAAGRGTFFMTSADLGEGKTTTVVHLAASLASTGASVLVVDADLRRPALHRHFETPRGPGLSELILGRCRPSRAIRATPSMGVQLLPCGETVIDPALLLASPAMGEIVRALGIYYDWVLLDGPPLLGVPDALALSPLVDGVITVVAAGTCGWQTACEVQEELARAGARVCGVVLNRADPRRNWYYYGRSYSEYARVEAGAGTGEASRLRGLPGGRRARGSRRS